jgi:hypothetical protein
MVGPGGTMALWCRWCCRLVRKWRGGPPRAARAGTRRAYAGGHGGGGGPPGGTITPAMLADTFPGWRVSEAGGTCRARRGGGPREQDGPRPSRRVLTAPDFTALAVKLCLQERIARTGGLTAAELAAVWRDEVVLPGLTEALA